MAVLWLMVGILIGAAFALLLFRGRLVRAQAEIEHERSLSGERIAALQGAQAGLASQFKALSAEALQASLGQLAELSRAHLQTAEAEAKGDSQRRQQALETLVAPLREQLGRVDAKLVELDRERRESRGRLEAQLRTLSESSEKLRTETGALVTALRKPNARGQWGQMQLRKVVELAGMVRHCDFTEQASFEGGEGPLRPDLVVNLPGGKHVVVDAKAPLQGVLDAYEAPDEEARMRHLSDHARLLRRHVKQLCDKAYWSELDSAPDMVVMFLPGEHLFSAALEADPELIGDAMARRVLIATPTTLLALLHSVAYGWQQERVAESAQAISELGRDLHGRLVRLSGLFATLGKRLNSTVSAYNETVASYESRVLPGARRFAEHGAVAEARELPEVEPVTVAARAVAVASREEPSEESANGPHRLFEAPLLRAADQSR